MKEPQIDIQQTAVKQHIDRVGFKNKFLRLWGHDGTTLTEKHKYYPKLERRNIELFKFLNMYENLKESTDNMKGIDSAWIYLNPEKMKSLDLTEEMLVQTMEFSIPDGVYNITIAPKTVLVKKKFSGIFGSRLVTQEGPDTLGVLSSTYVKSDSTIDHEVLGEYIKDNYNTLVADYMIDPNGTPDEDSEDIDVEVANLVAMYALGGSNGFSVEVTGMTYTFSESAKIVEKDDGTSTSYPYRTKALNIEMKLVQTGIIGEDDPIIQKIVAKYNAIDAANEAKNATNASVDSVLNKVAKKTDDVWLDGLMRSEIFSAKVIKTKDLVPILTGSIDTGHRKEKTKWYSKVFTFIVLIVAVYLAIISGGSLAPLAKVALVATVATLAVTVASAAMTAWGDYSGGAFAGKLSQGLGKISAIVGFLNLANMAVNALRAAATEGAKQAAAQELGKQAAEVTVTELAAYQAKQSLLDTIAQTVTELFKSTGSNLSAKHGMTVANKLYGMHTDNKLEKLSARLESSETKEASYAELEEQMRSKDMSKEFMKVSAEVLTDSIDDPYDNIYSGWSTNMHIGNIQKTSWKWNRTGAKDGLSQAIV